jgi:hypothetical protein
MSGVELCLRCFGGWLSLRLQVKKNQDGEEILIQYCLLNKAVSLFVSGPITGLKPSSEMKMAVFWVVAACSLIEVYRRFRGTCCLHHQGTHRPDDVGNTSLVNYYQTTGRYNPEDSHLQNLKWLSIIETSTLDDGDSVSN